MHKTKPRKKNEKQYRGERIRRPLMIIIKETKKKR